MNEENLENDIIFNNKNSIPKNKKNKGIEYWRGLFLGLFFGFLAFCFCNERNGTKNYWKGLKNGFYVHLLVLLILISIFLYLYSKKLEHENEVYKTHLGYRI